MTVRTILKSDMPKYLKIAYLSREHGMKSYEISELVKCHFVYAQQCVLKYENVDLDELSRYSKKEAKQLLLNVRRKLVDNFFEDKKPYSMAQLAKLLKVRPSNLSPIFTLHKPLTKRMYNEISKFLF